jgi:hypothetical protein
MTLSKGGRLEVDLTRAIEEEEWAELLDAILEALPILDRVVFLFPQGFDAGQHAPGLDELFRILDTRGVATERRHETDRPPRGEIPGDGP